VVIKLKIKAPKNDEGFTAEAPKLAEAKELRFVGRQMTFESSEVNFSQSLTMMLYASDISLDSMFIL
jgi:hypothetical protein